MSPALHQTLPRREGRPWTALSVPLLRRLLAKSNGVQQGRRVRGQMSGELVYMSGMNVYCVRCRMHSCDGWLCVLQITGFVWLKPAGTHALPDHI